MLCVRLSLDEDLEQIGNAFGACSLQQYLQAHAGSAHPPHEGEQPAVFGTMCQRVIFFGRKAPPPCCSHIVHQLSSPRRTTGRQSLRFRKSWSKMPQQILSSQQQKVQGRVACCAVTGEQGGGGEGVLLYHPRCPT